MNGSVLHAMRQDVNQSGKGFEGANLTLAHKRSTLKRGVGGKLKNVQVNDFMGILL